MGFLFWLSIGILFYIYIGYPLLLLVLPKNKTKVKALENFPTITVCIPAFNEEDVIKETIVNKLEQNYPKDKVKIIVISDESEDNTDSIVLGLSEVHDNVELIRQTPRKGKTSGLNLAYERVNSDLIVFSDANSLYDSNALMEIAKAFTDESVGYATGKMVYVNADGSMVGDGCSAYMKYENHMRSLESAIGSVVGVDGGIDAIRAELFSKLNADQLPDFVQPLKVVEQSKRVVYQPTAILKEESLSDNGSEFKMRVRVSLRALWALYDMRVLFNPRQFGLFSFQLFSHKLIRYLAFVPMVLALLSNIALLGTSAFYNLAMFSQILFYGLAYVGYTKPKNNNKFVGLAYYFCLINYAAAIASMKFFKGEKIVTWKPRQG